MARAAFATLAAVLEGKADRALAGLEEGLEDALAVLSLPEKYRVRLRTTNGMERLNEEIRRRGSGRQGRASRGVEVPTPSIARFGRLAYPMDGEVTNRHRLGRTSHGCPVETLR
jgi:Transposase, Mutator family